MSSAPDAPATVTTASPARARLPRTAELAWNAGLVVLVVLLLAWQAGHVRRWGAFELQTLFTSTLPLAFLAVAQAVVVIGGGIDLSVGAAMVLVNCASSLLLADLGFGSAVAVSLLVLLVGAVVGALVGWVISFSGVPDIIVTLALSFVWLGIALVVLPSPGGGVNADLAAPVNGSGTFWTALIVLAVPVLVVWEPLRRGRLGLAVYATGSDPGAAFLAGVRAWRAKAAAYGVAGFFTALAGLATTAYTGGGQASPTVAATATLASVAAVVLGGVALAGGRGGVVGPILAVWILFLVPADLLTAGVDPSYGEVVKGVVLVLVVLAGSLVQRRRKA